MAISNIQNPIFFSFSERVARGPSHERVAESPIKNENLRPVDQIHLSPFLIQPFENHLSCPAKFPFHNGLLNWIFHPQILIEPVCFFVYTSLYLVHLTKGCSDWKRNQVCMDKDLWDQRSLEGKSYDVDISVFVGWEANLFKSSSNQFLFQIFRITRKTFFAVQYVHKKIDIMSSKFLFAQYI